MAKKAYRWHKGKDDCKEEGAQKEPAQGELLSTDMTIDQHTDEEL